MVNDRKYFVTICTKNRAKCLSEIKNDTCILSPFGKCVEGFIIKIPEKYFNVAIDTYIIMPNHIHMIIVIGAETHAGRDPHLQPMMDRLLPKIIGYFKMNSSKHVNQIRNTPGVALWQRKYYEHVIRNQGSLQRIRNYIGDNPKNWTNDEYK
jgi:putative transposase